jgi:hypothetical protein
LKYKQYSKRLLFTTALLFVLVVAFNLLIDPYGIFDTPKIDYINSNKPEFGKSPFMTKAYAVQNIKPEAVCLGSSRADTGIDPAHPGWVYRPVYNLALRGGHMYETYRYFQYANAIKPLKQVVLSVDFFAFNGNVEEPTEFSEKRLSSTGNYGLLNNDQLNALFSIDGLISSIKTVVYQQNEKKIIYLEDGQRRNEFTPDPVRTRFNQDFRMYLTMRGYYSIRRGDEFSFVNNGSNTSTFDYYREILKASYSDDIDLKIITSPCHVTQWETLAIANLWDKWEEWKRELVTINEQESKNAGKTAFPLFDFSRYNDVTTEAIPTLGEKETEMVWYWDPSHYKKELGDLVLNQVFGLPTQRTVVPDNFGLLLTTNNIERDLEKIRQDRKSYEVNHPEEVAIIQAIKDSLSGN